MSEFIKIEIPNLQARASFPYVESIKKEIKKPKFDIYAIMVIDDAVDRGILDEEYYLECKDIIERIWNGEDVKTDGLKQSLLEQVKYLRELYDDRHKMAYPLYRRWMENLSLGYEDASRRWKILPKKELNDLNSRLGENLDLIARSWGPSAKLADNLSDIWNDIFLSGFINVPKEEIENLRGIEIQSDRVEGVDEGDYPSGLIMRMLSF
jgi:hypothetical protein